MRGPGNELVHAPGDVSGHGPAGPLVAGLQQAYCRLADRRSRLTCGAAQVYTCVVRSRKGSLPEWKHLSLQPVVKPFPATACDQTRTFAIMLEQTGAG